MNYPSQDKADSPKNKGAKKGNKREFKPPKKITERYLHNSGLHYLERFPASSAHFKTVMMRKINKSCRHHVDQDREICAELLNALIAKFQDWGLLDDKAYLKGMVTSYRRRGMASRQIEAKLRQKGLPTDEIIAAITKYDQEELEEDTDGEFHAATLFARKKRLGPYDVAARHTPEKTLATFARAGFSYDIAKKILEKNKDELDIM